MMAEDEIGAALANLGNWRVIHVQAATYPYKPWSASLLLALGFHESSLKNICGGATWDPATKRWVQAYTDRGWLQISDQLASNQLWLKSMPGCKNGEWTLDPADVDALTPMHCPRFSDALSYTLGTLNADMQFATRQGVPASDRQRFAVAAHNAGAEGALQGWEAGDVDKNTADGDYSASVLAVVPEIHAWIVAHPEWEYTP
jgi:hypothetical protein